jgi:P-type conjugative transfer protein TrbJ
MIEISRICAAVLLTLAAGTHAQVEGIPTGDIANFVQNSITAQEGVKQTMKQVEQYRTQLQEYALQIKNAAAPAAYVWDQAQKTMNALLGAIDTLAYYKRQMGDINFYLRQFNDVHDYRGSPCFGPKGCTGVELAQQREHEAAIISAQKRANEAAIRAIDQQQDAIQADARRLETLQRNAQGAQGHMEAISAANMLAAQQSNQLLQIRAVLNAQNVALVTRQQALTDREAREAAASAEFRSGTFTPSPKREW